MIWVDETVERVVLISLFAGYLRSTMVWPDGKFVPLQESQFSKGGSKYFTINFTGKQVPDLWRKRVCSEDLRPVVAQVELFVEHVLFYHRAVRDHDLRPEPGLGVDHDPVPQDDPGADDGVVLDAAVLPDMGVVVHDAAGDRGVRPDDDPVVERGREDLHVVPEDAFLPDARVGADQHVVADGRAGGNRHRADDPRVLPERDRTAELDRSLDLSPVHGEVPDDIGKINPLEFPPLRLPQGMRAPDIRPVPPGQPAFEGMAFFHQPGE